MLIEFSLKNYLSFKEASTFSMLGSTSVKEFEAPEEPMQNVFLDSSGKKKYLKSAVIYGSNGSGKSNLLTAVRFFKRFILNSSNDRQAEDPIDTIPFLFDSKTENEPSSFEMVFVVDNMRYRYGFEVDKAKVISEWLLGCAFPEAGKESTYFNRTGQTIKISARTFKEGKGLEKKTRPNALFLSTVAQLNGEIATKLHTWFRQKLNIISGLEDTTIGYTIGRFQQDKKFRKKVLAFMKIMDLGIEDIQIEETGLASITNNIPKELESAKIQGLIAELEKEILNAREKFEDRKEVRINTVHKKKVSNKLIDRTSIDYGLESRGTQKLFCLLGPWFDSLEKGKIILIDELDSRLHTKLTIELVKIFQSSLNAHNAQLIFASHDTNLLRNDLFRRDQIWFAEKDEEGSTDLYSLVEYKINQAISVRNDASFEKDYLLGKYGAIPFFGNVQKFITDFSHE